MVKGNPKKDVISEAMNDYPNQSASKSEVNRLSPLVPCPECIYRVDNTCRRNPPQVDSGVCAFPKVTDETSCGLGQR
jgi:hypothetical protein